MVLMGVGSWAGKMAASWFEWTVDWMAGLWAVSMIPSSFIFGGINDPCMNIQ